MMKPGGKHREEYLEAKQKHMLLLRETGGKKSRMALLTEVVTLETSKAIQAGGVQHQLYQQCFVLHVFQCLSH